MNRPVKLIVRIALISLTLMVVAAIYLIATFDPNKYRDTITEQVRAETGRTLTLAEPLTLHLFPWIGIELGAVQLSGPKDWQQDQSFIDVNRASIKARILPLLQQRLEADTIILDGLTANLITKKKGQNNWDFNQSDSSTDQAPSNMSTAPSQPAPGAAEHNPIDLARLAINGIDMRNTTINWNDASTDQQLSLTSLSLQTGQIKADSPIPISLKTTITGTPVQDQQLKISLDTQLRLSADGQAITLDQTRLQANDLVITAQLKARLDSGQYNGQIKLAPFNPRTLIGTLMIDLPAMSDEQALTQVALALAFSGNAGQIDVSKINLTLDDTTISGSATSTFAPTNEQAEAQSKIQIQNKNQNQKQQQSATFILAIDRLNLDRYLPPTEADTATNGKSEASDPTPDQTLDQTLDQPLDLPREALRPLLLNGQLTIGELTVSGLKSQNLSIPLKAQQGVIKLAPVTADLYQGKTSAKVQLDIRKALPRFELRQQLTGFQALPFMQDLMDSDLISGKADLDANLKTQGNSIRELIRQLNGTTAVAFTDGAIKGVNFADIARRADAKLKKQPVPDKALEQTDFTMLQATFQIRDGIARNNDLSALSPFVRLGGHGSADLNQLTIDYHVDATLVKDSKGQGGAGLNQTSGTTFPIRIRGPLTEPEIKLDSVAVREKLKDKAKEQVREQLNDKLEQKQEQLKTDIRKKAKSVVNDKLKQKLKNLF